LTIFGTNIPETTGHQSWLFNFSLMYIPSQPQHCSFIYLSELCVPCSDS